MIAACLRSPGVRIVSALTSLSAAMSAPSFVAAALGEPAPSHVRLQGRTLYVASRATCRRIR